MNNETTLMAWYKLNKKDESARQFAYGNIPENYSYDSKTKQWITRYIFSKKIGRILSVSPKDIERFHLKLIIHRVSKIEKSMNMLFTIFFRKQRLRWE